MDNEIWEVIRSTLGAEIADAAWDIAFNEGLEEGEDKYYENMQE